MITKSLLTSIALIITLAPGASANGIGNGVMIDWERQTPIAGDGAPMLSRLCEQNPGLAICGPFFDTVPPVFRDEVRPGISNGFIIAPRTLMPRHHAMPR